MAGRLRSCIRGISLVRLAPLIRPLIEVHWTRMVARLNGVARAEEDLRRHLFGSARPDPPAWLGRGNVGSADPVVALAALMRWPAPN